MNRTIARLPMLVILLTMIGCSSHDHDDHGHAAHGHDDHAHDESSRGPHGGRLLSKDAFTIELSIFETGVEPHFRAYVTVDGKSIPPDQVELRVQLLRING